MEFKRGIFNNPELERALLALYTRKYEMMASRHRKYGPGNIAVSGELGIIVRIKDKLARLMQSGDDFPDEARIDAWMDAANYADIAVLWNRGEWPQLPTHSDACPACGKSLLPTLFEDGTVKGGH